MVLPPSYVSLFCFLQAYARQRLVDVRGAQLKNRRGPDGLATDLHKENQGAAEPQIS